MTLLRCQSSRKNSWLLNTEKVVFYFALCFTGVSDVNLQNNAGYTAVMLASLTAPDGMEVVRKLMELGNIHIRSNQVTRTLQTQFKCNSKFVSLSPSTLFLWSKGKITSKQTITRNIEGPFY